MASFSLDICCAFLLLLSFAEHLILFLRCERERKSFHPQSWNTPHLFLFTHCGRLYSLTLSACKQACIENCLPLDADSSILGASAAL